MATRAQDQLALDETVVDDADLEGILERRLRAHDDASEARLVFTRADEAARAEIARHGDALDSGPIRVGRFRIERKTTAPRSVSFETEAKDRISIGLIDDAPAPRKPTADQLPLDADLRPTGEVNTDELRGIAERSVTDEPTPIRKRKPD